MAAAKRPTAKKKTTAKRTTAKKGTSNKKGGRKAQRIDKLVAAQKQTIKHVSDFVGNIATLTAKGNFSPVEWMDHYATLLKGLSEDLADATKALLND